LLAISLFSPVLRGRNLILSSPEEESQGQMMRYGKINIAIVRALIFALALIFQLSATSVHSLAQAQTAQPSQIPGPPPAQYIPNRDYDTHHIKLDLRFDWEREQALGVATITFAPLVSNLRSVEFDATDMTFNSVKLISGTSLQFKTDAAKEKLRIALDRAYQPKEVLTVIIDYRTNGAATQRGLYGSFGRGLRFIKPTPREPDRPRQIWSQSQPEYSHYWFPCYDHPNDFATTEISATVEKPLMVISNGNLMETKNHADNTRTFHWKINQPHAIYLTSLVVGEYSAIKASYDGIPVTTYVYPQEAEQGKVTAARLPEMVKLFSEKTGIKYPYPKYAQTAARDFGGAMENITATTISDQLIFDARSALDQSSEGLQAHELSHQWFGAYVTCRSWSDLWLNEGFATYFQAIWDEHSLGRDEFLYRDVKANQEAYLSAWQRGERRPIVTNLYTRSDAQFDVYSYQRGGAVLHMLRKALGEENWWRSINHYLTKYAHQPVQTEQFRIAIEEATGQSMDWFFDQWVYRMGHPVFYVSQDYDQSSKVLKLTVKQEQKMDTASIYPQADLFQMPLEIEIGTAAGTRIERIRIEPRGEQTFSFSVDSQPLLVNFDYGNTLIKELRFDKTTDELTYQLSNDQDVMGRLWALNQLFSRLRDKATVEADKQKITGSLISTLSGDKFWGVRMEAASMLGRVPGEATRQSLIAATRDRNAKVRGAAIGALIPARDPQLANLYIELLNDQSYSVIRSAAIALGLTKSPAAYAALVKLINLPSWRDSIRFAGLAGLAALEDRRALDFGLQYSQGGNPLQVRAAAVALLGSVGRDDKRAFAQIKEVFLLGLSKPNFSLAGEAAGALVRLGDPRAAEIFAEARKETNDPQLQSLIEQFERRLKQRLETKPQASGQ
jgi:aminopeptidase N